MKTELQLLAESEGEAGGVGQSLVKTSKYKSSPSTHGRSPSPTMTTFPLSHNSALGTFSTLCAWGSHSRVGTRNENYLYL